MESTVNVPNPLVSPVRSFRAMGKELAERLVKGCSVHYGRGYLKAAAKFTDGGESKETFLRVAKIIPHCKSQVLQSEYFILEIFNAVIASSNICCNYVQFQAQIFSEIFLEFGMLSSFP